VNSNDLEKYFKSFNIQKIEKTESKSETEMDFLFKGDLNNLTDWLAHEEFRIKEKNQKLERELRKGNAFKAFLFSSVWAIFIAVFILLHSFEQINHFKITSTEFMFVCGTLTTSILIFYLTVIRNLFPTPKE
jgi:hypothetical protein